MPAIIKMVICDVCGKAYVKDDDSNVCSDCRHKHKLPADDMQFETDDAEIIIVDDIDDDPDIDYDDQDLDDDIQQEFDSDEY